MGKRGVTCRSAWCWNRWRGSRTWSWLAHRVFPNRQPVLRQVSSAVNPGAKRLPPPTPETCDRMRFHSLCGPLRGEPSHAAKWRCLAQIPHRPSCVRLMANRMNHCWMRAMKIQQTAMLRSSLERNRPPVIPFRLEQKICPSTHALVCFQLEPWQSHRSAVCPALTIQPVGSLLEWPRIQSNPVGRARRTKPVSTPNAGFPSLNILQGSKPSADLQ